MLLLCYDYWWCFRFETFFCLFSTANQVLHSQCKLFQDAKDKALKGTKFTGSTVSPSRRATGILIAHACSLVHLWKIAEEPAVNSFTYCFTVNQNNGCNRYPFRSTGDYFTFSKYRGRWMVCYVEVAKSCCNSLTVNRWLKWSAKQLPSVK